MEKIRLAFLNAQIGKYAGKDEVFASVMDAELKKTLGNTASVSADGDGYLVTYGDMKFEVSKTGGVERKSGVIITQKVGKIKNTSTAPVTAMLDGISGTISWKSSDDSIVKVTGSGTSATIEGKASSGYATITAYIAGTEHEDSFRVDIAQTATGITANPATASIAKNATTQMGVTVSPEGVVEDLTYTYASDTTSVATVDANGVVTGVGSGTATITITAVENTNLTTTCTVTVTKVAVESVQIKDANGETQTVRKADVADWYGKEVKNYTGGPSGTKWRIFYIDYEGKYGNSGTIYLKADYDSNRNVSLSSYSSYNTDTTLIRDMNPNWAEGATSSTTTLKRGNAENVWKDHEKATAYLCTPEKNSSSGLLPWSAYYGNGADFVIGSPSVEMYCDSYNQVPHTTLGNYSFEAIYCAPSNSNSNPGYNYKYTDLSITNSTSVTPMTTTPGDVLDYSKSYGNMYCGIDGKKGSDYLWLASPSTNYNGDGAYNYCVCTVSNYDASLGRRGYGQTQAFCPLVSLSSSFIPSLQTQN